MNGREIIWDTETTGVHKGCRVVEIAGVELHDLQPTGRTFHEYIDPGVPMPAEAQRIHGLSDAFLKGKPSFKVVIPRFLRFIRGARLVAHNASFDLRVINDELALLGLGGLTNDSEDTLAMARKKFPGAKASLDALCAKFGVSTAKRVGGRHGALVDCEILAEVYLHLCGGRQRGLDLGDLQAQAPEEEMRPAYPPGTFGRRRITAEELGRHASFVSTLSNPIWADYMGEPEEIALAA